jgi:hypothetical protein
VGGECKRSVRLIIIKGQCPEIIDKSFFSGISSGTKSLSKNVLVALYSHSLQFFLTGIDPRPRILHPVLPEPASSGGCQCQRHSRRRLGSSADGSVTVMFISFLVVLFILF